MITALPRSHGTGRSRLSAKPKRPERALTSDVGVEGDVRSSYHSRMKIEPEPELIESQLSRSMEWDGARLDIQIYRLATERGWTLEVVNELGTSIVWDEPFGTARDADTAFRDTLARDGVEAFLDPD